MEEQVQSQTAQNQPSQSPAESFAIPEAYKDRSWATSLKSNDDLWKLTDNAQSLIGKRPAGIPAKDAPDEEWQKFYNSARPAKAEDYKFTDVEGLPEGFDASPYKQKAASILHEAGLTERQAQKVWDSYIKSELEAAGKSRADREAQDKALDAEFDKLTGDIFGDKYEESAKLAQDLIAKHVPAELVSSYSELANNPKAMVAVIKALDGAQREISELHKKYGVEGSLPSGNGSSQGGESLDSVRTELAKLRVSPAARDFTNPEHKATMEKIDMLSQKVRSSIK